MSRFVLNSGRVAVWKNDRGRDFQFDGHVNEDTCWPVVTSLVGWGWDGGILKVILSVEERKFLQGM